MCGVGGRTIAEAQQHISYQEFARWAAFRKKRGSLHVGMRVEHGAAVLASLYANAHSKHGGKKVTDFMPHMDEPPMSLEQAMEAWQ